MPLVSFGNREIVPDNATCRLAGGICTIPDAPNYSSSHHMCRLSNKPLQSHRVARACAIAFVLCAMSKSGLIGTAVGQNVRYVTRFETQERVAYEPQVQFVEQIVNRSSWNPFRPQSKPERRVVPVVRWVPRPVAEKMPVTERQAVRNLPRNFAQLPPRTDSRMEDVRLVGNANANRNDRWQPRRESATVARAQASPTPIPTLPNRSWRSVENAEQYGGVQRFDEDSPRIGMQLRELR